jgi:ribosome-associated toxin RatA of RatAB toxin-antitoxin module
MDIVKITMMGYGCEIARGIITPQNYKKVENLIDNVWHKNLFKKLKGETKIKTYSEDYGIIKG